VVVGGAKSDVVGVGGGLEVEAKAMVVAGGSEVEALRLRGW
jgi:hypothetical protein